MPSISDADLLREVLRLHQQSGGRWGRKPIIRALRADGYTFNDHRVMAALRVLGVRGRDGPVPGIRVNRDRLNKIIDLYAKGYTQAQIGEKLGTHQFNISRSMRQHGIPRRDRRSRYEPVEKRACWGCGVMFFPTLRHRPGRRPIPFVRDQKYCSHHCAVHRKRRKVKSDEPLADIL